LLPPDSATPLAWVLVRALVRPFQPVAPPKKERSTLRASTCTICRLRGRVPRSRASRWPRDGDILPGSVAPADPSLVGFTALVADLDRVSDLLTRNQVPFQVADGRLVVAAADACGCAVRFEV
jgi:hypothetical protein